MPAHSPAETHPRPPVTNPSTPSKKLHPAAWALLSLNLLLLAGQAGFGKQAALVQRGIGLQFFFLNPFYLATMACLGFQALVWPLVLKRVPLGFAYGMNSLNCVTTLVISRLLFGEAVTPANMAGAGLIMAGLWIWAYHIEGAR